MKTNENSIPWESGISHSGSVETTTESGNGVSGRGNVSVPACTVCVLEKRDAVKFYDCSATDFSFCLVPFIRKGKEMAEKRLLGARTFSYFVRCLATEEGPLIVKLY